jgi:circadian clock protein KaiB
MTVGATHKLKLFVAGSGSRSLRAIRNLLRVLENDVPGRYNLEVVDIYQHPGRASKEDVVAVPMLVRDSPGIHWRMVGDLSEADLLKARLGI